MKDISHTQQSSIAGEFSVLSRLSMEGLIGTLTLGNAKSVDVLILNPKTNKLFKLEVKSRLKQLIKHNPLFENGEDHYEWPHLNEKHENIFDDSLFYCFVEIQDENTMPKYYIVPSKDVAKYVEWENKHWWSKKHKSRKTGKLRGLEEAKKEGQPNQKRSFRINIKTNTNELFPSKNYLNRFDFFK
jgi:hypothetical protein